MTSHTAPLTPAQAETLRRVLEDRGFDFEPKPHALFSARKGKLNVTVYQKGPKVLIQGKDTEDFIRFTLEPEVLGEAQLGYEEILEPDKFEPHFGIDESGKGDFFGPLVIAGVFTDAIIARRLIEAGVMDSKRVTSAARIRKLAAAIRATPGCTSDVVSIGPERYNEMHASFGNLNRLLAWGHARVIENLAAAPPGLPARPERPIRPPRSPPARPPPKRPHHHSRTTHQRRIRHRRRRRLHPRPRAFHRLDRQNLRRLRGQTPARCLRRRRPSRPRPHLPPRTRRSRQSRKTPFPHDFADSRNSSGKN